MKIARILISQPTPTSEKNPFSDLVAKHKTQLDFHPFINIEKITLKEFRAQRIEILNHDAIIFTSKTAIDHLFATANEARIVIPDSMKYFCITEAIALYLQKYIVYRKRKIFFGKTSFPELVELIAKHKDLKYLLPLCEQHKPEIPALLSKSSIQYSKVIISHSVVNNIETITPGQYQMMVFYSPAEVKAMTQYFKINQTVTKIATFGKTTANALFEAGMTVDLAVPTPEMPSMTMALDKYLTSAEQNENLEPFALRIAPMPKEIVAPHIITPTKKANPKNSAAK